MASTLTLKSATPYALKYAYAYDGAGGAGSATASIAVAQLILDAASAASGPDPLHDYLATLATGGLAFAQAPNGPQLSLYATTQSLSPALSASFNGGTNKLDVSGLDGTAGGGTVEIRYHHTFDR